MREREAVTTLLEAGYDVERKGVHLYQRGGSYKVLSFGAGAVGEEYENVNDAIDRHAALAG